MCKNQYDAKETVYLLRNPINAERLRQSIRQAEEGKIAACDLIESYEEKVINANVIIANT